jgi:hypothetical protein
VHHQPTASRLLETRLTIGTSKAVYAVETVEANRTIVEVHPGIPTRACLGMKKGERKYNTIE